MADWVQLGAQRRYNPQTGDFQVNRKGEWQDAGKVQYDPQTGMITQGDREPVFANQYNQFGVPGYRSTLPTIDELRQISMMQQMGAGGGGGGGGAATQAAQGQLAGAAGGQQMNLGNLSYLYGNQGSTGTSAGGGTSSMTWDQVAQQIGLAPRDVTAFQNQGYSPDEILGSFQSTGRAPTTPPASKQTQSGTSGLQPEQVALQQMAQIDPVSEALRQGLGASYISNLGGGPQIDVSRGAAAPTAADVQSYLNLYKRIDPEGFKQRAALAGQMGSYLSQAQQEAALGAQLDPGTIREVEQATRRAQTARGNAYGTAQLVQEAMERGSMGEARKQQRQQALSQALGQQQGYLTSGAGMGDVANNLYQQGYGRYTQALQQNLNARLAGQQGALSYLSSGQTPYQAGASYYDRAQAAAANAAQGGPQYQPSALGQQYTGGGAGYFPQYGLGIGQQANSWYNSLNAYSGGGGGSARSPGMKALSGAATGALSGAATGTAITPGIGTVIGGLGGAVLGGVGGYAS